MKGCRKNEFDILFCRCKNCQFIGMAWNWLKNAVHLYSDIRVIIFSGFSEFEYARTAIRIGCVNYILKIL